MTILVTGATGNVGRAVVEQLVERGHRVRALSRDPGRAALPAGVEVVCGDLAEPGTLDAAFDGLSAVHLMTYNADQGALTTGPELAKLVERSGARRVSVLWSGSEGSVERALEAGPTPWTFVQPGEFMSNALTWADSIRTEGVVREPFARARNASVHEGDVAAVAVHALTEDGHAGRRYVLSGPEALTVPQKVAVLGAALGRELRYVELTEEQARERWRESGASPEAVDMLAEWHRDPPPEGYTVVPTVREVTGRPARSFADWAAERADRFR
ncbi:NmrA family NAD(P)-binding protein [Streptomyces buecherae]|uniref:NmrA family NAD(P)-binding protein n=1 Tax=Streptomyces buecherae TaxID=2763006 RepID=UPI001C270D79|nr:NAD(P)H-binding protein [Streptomyces buecherae]